MIFLKILLVAKTLIYLCFFGFDRNDPDWLPAQCFFQASVANNPDWLPAQCFFLGFGRQ